MRHTETSTKFRRDFKNGLKGRYSGLLKGGGEFDAVRKALERGISLPARYRDHALHNNWEGFRECHIRPDLLLVYAYIGDDTLWLERLGTHTEIFGL